MQISLKDEGSVVSLDTYQEGRLYSSGVSIVFLSYKILFHSIIFNAM